jgi:type IV pilus assembly protein PilB
MAALHPEVTPYGISGQMTTQSTTSFAITAPQALRAMMEQRSNSRNLKLGSLLVEAGVTTPEAVVAALNAQAAGNKGRLGDILVAMNAAHPDDVERIIQQYFGMPFVDLAKYPVNPAALKKLAAQTAQQGGCLPFELIDNTLYVAFPDVAPWDVLNALKFASGCSKVVGLRAVSPEVLKRLVARHCTSAGSLQIRSNVMTHEQYDNATQGDTSPAAQFRKILATAVGNNASDVHIHPQPDGTRRVLLRIDGLLRESPSMSEKNATALVRHLEALSGMALRGQKEAKEGRLSMTQDGFPVDVRVSIVPGASGDSVVLRVLDPARFPESIAHLGLEPAQHKALAGLISRPQGLFLVTGPTGSGKTTTLYTLLRQLHMEKKVHVATAEDPVEYRLPGINQFDTSDFAQTLKQLLRHDPDVLMVGELRDVDGAVTAVNAAITGHLVLSTVHANDSISAVHRLLGLGVAPVLLASCLTGVMSQRLVRLSCKVCEGQGCESCHNTGYAGRRLVAELARPTYSFADELHEKSSYKDILQHTDFAGGYRLDDVMVKMATEGDTDWHEIASLITDPRRLPKSICEGLGLASGDSRPLRAVTP